MSSKPPRKGSNTATQLERTKLRPGLVRVDMREELVARPAVSPGLFSRAEICRRFTKVELAKQIRQAGYKPMGGGGEVETHVELSAAVPWVDGRGWLEAGGTLQNWFATSTIAFYPDKPNQQQGILSIWLDGLTEGDAYAAQIRVGGWSANPQLPGTFHIGASDASHADIIQSGASQTLSVLMPGVSGTLSLINIETKGLGGWSFDDVLVTHLGNLS